MNIQSTPDLGWSDTDKMTQVIDNILNNAIKYSPDEENQSRDRKQQMPVDYLYLRWGQEFPRRLATHFWSFYRVDKARSRAQGRTGLGLAIAKEIISSTKTIWAKSEYGKGSTLTIVLPCDKDAIKDDDWDTEEEKNKGSMTEEDLSTVFAASGSSGILSILRHQEKLLIDAGLSGKKITGLLTEIDRKPEDLDAILITHNLRPYPWCVGV